MDVFSNKDGFNPNSNIRTPKSKNGLKLYKL